MFSVRRLLHTLPSNVKTRSPSVTDYTVKLMASANSGHFADCLKTSAQIKSAGMKPDASIYNALMSLAARDASWLFSWAVFDDMLLSGVQPTSTTFAHLVNVTPVFSFSLATNTNFLLC
jgi:pentatricopeptide repeat protein